MPAQQEAPLKLAIEEEIPLDTHPNIKIRVRYDNEIGKKVHRYAESLMVSRSILDDASITGAHPSVLMLMTHWQNTMKVREAIDIVKQSTDQFRLMAQDGAYKVAMIDDLFVQTREKGGALKVKLVIPGLEGDDEIVIPADYWNDNTENVDRMDTWTAPFPQLKPHHPIEQRVGLVYELLRRNPLFAMRYVNLLQAAVLNLMDDAMEVAGRKRETDEEGFRPNTMGGDLVSSPVAES